jgi:hypothetical protein
MWTNRQFWKDATWRSFRTFCQSLAGLLTVEHVSSNLNASWWALLYASGVAGLISLLQSVDRERAVGGAAVAATHPTPEVAVPEVVPPVVVSDPAAADYQP